jgi:hypothetical protein
VTIDRKPKQAYAVMQQRFTQGQAAVVLDATPTLRAVSGGIAELVLDGETWFRLGGGAGGGRGITVGVLDQTTGIRLSDVRTYDTWLSPSGFGSFHVNFPPLCAYLDSLPDGAVVMLAVGDEAGFINPNNGNRPMPDAETWYQAFEAIGSTKVRQVGYNGGWAMIFRKGHGVIAEAVSTPGTPAVVEAEVAVVLDADAGRRKGPRVLASTFEFNGPKPGLALSFSEDVAGSVAGSDLQVVRQNDGQVVPGGATVVSYDSILRRARFTFPGLPGGVLPDGDYRATLPAGAVADGAGDGSPTAHTLDYFVLAGDANRDRRVDFGDLVVLAQNYNTAGKTFAQGDFNYDDHVNFNDLVILAQRYNKSLPAPEASGASAPASFAADWAKATAAVTAPTATKPDPKRTKPTPVFSVAAVATAMPAKRKAPPQRRT